MASSIGRTDDRAEAELRARLLDQVTERLRLAPTEYLVGFLEAADKMPAEREQWLHGPRRAAGVAPASLRPPVAEAQESEAPAAPLAAKPYRIELHRWQGGIVASFSVLLANPARDAIVHQLAGVAYAASVSHGRTIVAEGRQVQTCRPEPRRDGGAR